MTPDTTDRPTILEAVDLIADNYPNPAQTKDRILDALARPTRDPYRHLTTLEVAPLPETTAAEELRNAFLPSTPDRIFVLVVFAVLAYLTNDVGRLPEFLVGVMAGASLVTIWRWPR